MSINTEALHIGGRNGITLLKKAQREETNNKVKFRDNVKLNLQKISS